MPSRAVILTVLAVLGLLHAYIGLRLIPAASLPAWGSIAAWLALTASWLLIPLGLLARLFSSRALADRLAWVGLTTLGLFSSLLVLCLARELVLEIAKLAGQASPALVADSALAVPVLALLVTLAGLVNARRLARVVTVEIPFAGLPAGLEGFTIVQLSDIHLGPTIKGAYLERVVARVNALQPDLVAITGDLVDGSVAQLAADVLPLTRLQSRHGSFFVTGNHEYYAGAKPWIAELRRLGIRVLMNEHVEIRHGEVSLVLAGVSDYTAHLFEPEQRSDPQAAIAGAPADAALRVLLAHQPRSAAAAVAAGFDLLLSGHTHGGQFLPWNLFVPLQQPFVAGLYRLQALWVYVSRGTGYWGPPKRFCAPAEITCLRLVRASDTSPPLDP